MPALINSGLNNIVVEWLGVVPVSSESLRSISQQLVKLTFAGIEGEDHSGLQRPSCTRVKHLYKSGTPIRNTRQMSLLSAEDIAHIGQDIGLDRLDPSLLGANIIIRGIPDFTLVPPSSRLQFQSGATITIDLENLPCHLPAKEIDKHQKGKGHAFKSAAHQRRGVTAWVEREGSISIGEKAQLFIPSQNPWPRLQGQKPDIE